MTHSIIGQPQRPPNPAGGLYVHWPICETKCGYCDFYSVPGRGVQIEPLLDAVLRELHLRTSPAEVVFETVFVGGGTPTTLDEEPLRALLAGIGKAVEGHPVREFTVEANPATVRPAKARVLREGGVTRVSLGAQSFHPDELRTLERLHRPEDIPEALAILRAAGLTHLNLDLIFGIPGQTMASWKESLARALELEPTHLACYGLTYESGTALTKQLTQGKLVPCDEGLEAEMLLCAVDVLAEAGFEHYEISNFARPGRRCRHNLIYWHNRPYVGIGPSAAGFVNGRRYKNIANHTEYVRRVREQGHAEAEAEMITGTTAAMETLMMRMRLIEGLDWAAFAADTGIDLREVAAGALAALEKQGLVQRAEDRLKLTRRGLLYADGIIAELATALDAKPALSLPIVQTGHKPGRPAMP